MKGKRDRHPDGKLWKIVSVIFIALFIAILLWAFTGMRPEHRFDEPTLVQAETAKALVAQDLLAGGDSIDNYDVLVTNRMLGFIGRSHPRNGMPPMRHEPCLERGTCPARNLQVSLRGNSTGYVYTVDIDEQRIMMKSFTEWFDG